LLDTALAAAEPIIKLRPDPATRKQNHIGVDTFNSYTVAGDELGNIPYTYTVG
jgi:hypothetical protein